MTEETKDNRYQSLVMLPIRRVTRLQEHPYEDDKRFYCVMEKTSDEAGKFAGWRHASKLYEHSTSAFAALGRLMQKDIDASAEAIN